jgi:cell division initiation protein
MASTRRPRRDNLLAGDFSMKITALDLTQRQFRRALRGLDPEEVHAFLGDAAAEFEALSREVLALREQLARRDEEIEAWKGRERMLQETLITAQRACDEIRDSARREADARLAEAELQAEKIVQGAHARFQRIVDEIHEMKRQRVQVVSEIRSVLRAHDKMLDAFGDGERDDRVEFLPSKKKAAEEG